MASCEFGTSRPLAFGRRFRVSLCLSLTLFCCTATAWVALPTPARISTNINPNRSTMPMPKKSTSISTRLESTSTTQQAEATAIMSSGLDPAELSLLMEVIFHECQQLGVVLSYDDDDDDDIDNTDTTCITSVSAPAVTLAATGALGRVLLFRASNFGDDPDLLEDLESGICEQVDMLLCDDDDDSDDDDDDDANLKLKDAVLIYFQTDDELELSNQSYQNEYKDDNHNIDSVDYCTDYLSAIIAQHIQEHEMASPIQPFDTYDKHKPKESSLVPSIHVELDGGYTSYQSHAYFDTSTLLVFDKLVGHDLRKRLLDVVIGEDSESDHYDARDGPNPNRWVRGGLLDVPDHNDPTLQSEDGDTAKIESSTHVDTDMDSSSGGGWGLTDEGLEEICFEHHDAIVEMESILSNLFPDFLVSRLPENVFGRSITPMTANAPTAGDEFAYHIDADPNITPSSPWTDVYGRYPNRAAGKPRFMSCLVYLNEEWDGGEWGAPTRFVDVPTEEDLTTYDVTPKPGRVIIMDQDVGHTVVAPNAAAGKRARYSLVWKLILHPKIGGQDMKSLAGGRDSLWPDTEYFGSAARDS